MSPTRTREEQRKIRHERVRKNIYGTPAKPRLSVYKSLDHLHVQVIDDSSGETLVAASTNESELEDELEGMTKTEQAERLGEVLAERAGEEDISKVVLDRGGFSYQGRVKAFADAARETGLEF